MSTGSTPRSGRSPRIAIAGGGFMAEVHSRAARSARAELAGVVSSTPESTRRAVTALGFERGYGSFAELLADDSIDVVHVCTPNALHVAQALAVIRAGKHIVCEKPISTTLHGATELVHAAADAGVIATVPFVYRFHPLIREARARVREGEMGRILSIQGSYLQDWLLSPGDDNWRVDPERAGRSRAFADIGSHLVDLIEFVTGERVHWVAATKRTFFADRAQHRQIETEDAVAVSLETSGGAIGTLLVSQVAPGRKNWLRLEIAGSAESIGFDQEQPETLWLGRRAGTRLITRDAGQLHEDAARFCVLPAGHPQGYQDAFNAFVADSYAAVSGSIPDGLPLFADGLRAVCVAEAVIDAAESGTWVEVSE